MLIVYGVAGLTLAVLVYAIVLIGCRNPRQPSWANDFLVGSIYVPAIGGLLVLGVGCILNFLLSANRSPFGVTEASLAAGIAAGGLVLLKALRVKKHLADYAAASEAGEVIHLKAGSPKRPSNGSSGKHSRSKHAA